MVAIKLDYQGDLHCGIVHGPSGTAISTDAPVDNHGRGESFSPTDLAAAALGSCMLTVMGIRARAIGANIDGTTAQVEKEMTAVPVRRIHRLTVAIHLPGTISEDHRIALIEAARGCPVARSLHPDIETIIDFRWG